MDIDNIQTNSCIPNNINFSNLNYNQNQNNLINPDNTYSPYLGNNQFINISSNDNEGNNNKNISQKLVKETKPKSIKSSCEIRLIKDLNELKNNKNIGKHCEIIVGDYTKIKDTNNFQLIIDFKNYFSVKCVFLPEYPFVPPIMTFYSGNKSPYIFDSEGNILLENAKKSNWTPIFWLSTLINSIELLIVKALNNNNKNSNCDLMFVPPIIKYGKRKWVDYVKDETDMFKDDDYVINELNKTIKGVKSLAV